MFTLGSKMMDAAPIYLVHCTGTKDGLHCPAMIALSGTEKTECPECGTMHLPWRQYLALRTRTKNG